MRTSITDLEAVKTAFKRLVNLVPRRGRVVAFDGSENVSECVAKAFCTVERYGFAEESEWQVRDLAHRDGGTEWHVLRGGKPWLALTLPMAGEHNALNATAAAALAAGQGVRSSGDCGCAGELQEREAAAGGAGRGARRDGDR